MTEPMTRKRALEIAQECIQKEMNAAYHQVNWKTRQYKQKYEGDYAELAAALAYIENMARQRELL